MYHEWRERVCSGAVLATALAVTALGAPRLWRRQETGLSLSHTRSNSWDGDTRTHRPLEQRSTDQWTLDTWTRVETASRREFASQRTKSSVTAIVNVI